MATGDSNRWTGKRYGLFGIESSEILVLFCEHFFIACSRLKKVDDPRTVFAAARWRSMSGHSADRGSARAGAIESRAATRRESQVNDLAQGEGAPFCIGKVRRNTHPLTIIVRGQQPRLI
jgi:hypothetical protein